MVTAIGLTCACAEYFSQITKLSYKKWVLILVGFAFFISNLGLTKLIAFSVPVLSAIYPPAITVILLGFCWNFFNTPSRVIAPVTVVAFAFGIVDGLKVAGFENALPNWITHLPLSEQNLAWLIPSLIVLVLCVAIDKLKK